MENTNASHIFESDGSVRELDTIWAASSPEDYYGSDSITTITEPE